MSTKFMEILAPVGSFDTLFSAVRSGADAVYFGLKEFSARRNAENFSYSEMENAVKYCKRNSVKTYLAINIQIKDNELENAFSVAKKAYLCGVDGLIVADLGLADRIHKELPDIELHASTQMSINSKASLKLLKEMGFCRVVPAREMSKNELVSFCEEAKRLDMDVEVFVHGALCVCLSGQCLMSSVLGARSGNRGLCAGPCRLPFSVKGGNGFALSLKDLSLYSHIKELEEMGVKSLKIEGRMKRPEYVASAVATCKSVCENGTADKKLNEILGDVFSRNGFTDGYFANKIDKNMFGVRSKEDAEKSKDTYSFIHTLYRTELARTPLKINVEIKADKNIFATFKAGEKFASVTGNVPKKSENKPLTDEYVKKLFSKLGGTPFFAESIEVNLDDGLFVSAGELNEIRRNATEKLCEVFEEIPKRRVLEVDCKIEDTLHSDTPKTFAKFMNISQIPGDLSGIDRVIIPLYEAEKELPEGVELAVELPRFTCDEKGISKSLKTAKEKGIKIALCGNLSAIILARNEGFEIMGDMGLNVFNERSARVLGDMGIKEITLSPEMPVKWATSMKTTAKKGVFAYGRLPLMCLRACPIKGAEGCKECDKKGFLTDRTGAVFPIRCHNGYSELFNSQPLFLSDRQDELSGLDFTVLSFTTEQPSECEKIIEMYKYKKSPTGQYTRGLYYKEVL